MSFSELPKDDIRLSTAFRHHFVRSVSPKENPDQPKNPKNNNYSLTMEPMTKAKIKDMIMNEETPNDNLSLKTGTIYISHLKLATLFQDTPRCFICHVEFKHLKDHKHFCKICGKAVCSKCSRKKRINGRRGCDICFLKLKNKAQGLRRKEFLRNKEKLLIDQLHTMKKLEIQIENISKNACDKNNQIIEDEKRYNEEYFNLNREIEKEEEVFQKRRENHIRLRKAIEVDQSIYRDKIKENEEIQTKINFMRIDLNSKNDILKNKQKNLLEIRANKEKYNELYKEISASTQKTFDPPVKNDNNTSNELENPMITGKKHDSFFIKYENDLNLSRIRETNESNLSPQNHLVSKVVEEEERKEKL